MVKRDRPESANSEGTCRPSSVPKAGSIGCTRDPTVAAFERWLRVHGVWWRDDLFGICSAAESAAVAAGWGLLAKAPVQPGQELFRVPRRACLGATCDEADGGDDVQFTDSQQKLATKILDEKALGQNSAWSPMLDMISTAPCPWVWPQPVQEFLDGTELAAVLQLKMQRLLVEAAVSAESVASAEYREACALVASHANPWFGGQTLVPFNFMMNCAIGGANNVETDAEGEFVVGRAVVSIHAGEELVHAYTESTAEMIYRYGMVCPHPTSMLGDGQVMLLADDSVCVEIHHINAKPPKSYRSKLRALVKASALADSAWDGLDDVVNAELKADGEGTARLVGAALVFAADEFSWSNATDLLAEFGWRCSGSKTESDSTSDGDSSHDDSGDEHDEEEDVVAALLVASLCGADKKETAVLQRTAVEAGGVDSDPWPALLQLAPKCAALEAARAAAAAAVDRRMDTLRTTRVPSSLDLTAAAIVPEAWRMSEHLRHVESAILASAKGLLEDERHALA
jgi:hypothetical protein